MPRKPIDPATGLTEMETNFIREFVTNGGKKERAAIDAGYSANGARTRAWETLRKPKIIKAVQEFRRECYQHDATSARFILKELMLDASVNDSVKANIALALIDRAGDKMPEVIEITDSRTPAEIATKLSLLLGDDGEVENVGEIRKH